ncbi:MAG TPA: histidinol dehydrogenase [Xanthomonadales bacterium]|nr:histidinol dehydrogenase [Xanthomonadales bacterium]
MKPGVQNWSDLDRGEQQRALARPEVSEHEFRKEVSWIINYVRQSGDAALLDLTNKLDGCNLQDISISREHLEQSASQVREPLGKAIRDAEKRIRVFHSAEIPEPRQIETAPGLTCEVRFQPIDAIGLYVPGGSAALVSTALMLGVPASLAGCSEIVLCTPPGPEGQVSPEILFAAELCGIKQVFAVGGAQAIAAMAYGTGSVPKCSKIFGPGNSWVTEAKQQVSVDPQGASIDMPAGPSEVLVIADESADPRAIAWDLLSQAEHGPDSQAILLSDSDRLATEVSQIVGELSGGLPRAEILNSSLKSTRIIVTRNIVQAIEISNAYAPEHLIINTRQARQHAEQARNAGSIFIGPWTPESLGDYCSGTNHVLPTYGWARSHNSLSVVDFMRRYTLQEASQDALQQVGPTAEALADFEGLEAHRMAVRYRIDSAGSS